MYISVINHHAVTIYRYIRTLYRYTRFMYGSRVYCHAIWYTNITRLCAIVLNHRRGRAVLVYVWQALQVVGDRLCFEELCSRWRELCFEFLFVHYTCREGLFCGCGLCFVEFRTLFKIQVINVANDSTPRSICYGTNRPIAPSVHLQIVVAVQYTAEYTNTTDCACTTCFYVQTLDITTRLYVHTLDICTRFYIARRFDFRTYYGATCCNRSGCTNITCVHGRQYSICIEGIDLCEGVRLIGIHISPTSTWRWYHAIYFHELTILTYDIGLGGRTKCTHINIVVV